MDIDDDRSSKLGLVFILEVGKFRLVGGVVRIVVVELFALGEVSGLAAWVHLLGHLNEVVEHFSHLVGRLVSSYFSLESLRVKGHTKDVKAFYVTDLLVERLKLVL